MRERERDGCPDKLSPRLLGLPLSEISYDHDEAHEGNRTVIEGRNSILEAVGVVIGVLWLWVEDWRAWGNG